jgi:hypothetical protein
MLLLTINVLINTTAGILAQPMTHNSDGVGSFGNCLPHQLTPNIKLGN